VKAALVRIRLSWARTRAASIGLSSLCFIRRTCGRNDVPYSPAELHALVRILRATRFQSGPPLPTDYVRAIALALVAAGIRAC
jgi:hypothetical protein